MLDVLEYDIPVDVNEKSFVYATPSMDMGGESREENDDLAHTFPLSGLVSVNGTARERMHQSFNPIMNNILQLN